MMKPYRERIIIGIIITAFLTVGMLISETCNGQSKGFASFDLSVFGSKKFETNVGANIAIGIGNKYGTIGMNADLYEFDKKKTQYSVLAADFRAYFMGNDKLFTPVLSVQPGWVIYNKTIAGISSKGGFSYSALGGVRVKSPKKMGFNFNIGYSQISFTTLSKTTRYGGVKFDVGLSF